jgi:hypothetical protein
VLILLHYLAHTLESSSPSLVECVIRSFHFLQLAGVVFFGIMLFRSLLALCGLSGFVLGHPFWDQPMRPARLSTLLMRKECRNAVCIRLWNHDWNFTNGISYSSS